MNLNVSYYGKVTGNRKRPCSMPFLRQSVFQLSELPSNPCRQVLSHSKGVQKNQKNPKVGRIGAPNDGYGTISHPDQSDCHFIHGIAYRHCDNRILKALAPEEFRLINLYTLDMGIIE